MQVWAVRKWMHSLHLHVCVMCLVDMYMWESVGTHVLQYMCEGQRIMLLSVFTFCLAWGWFRSLLVPSLQIESFQRCSSLLFTCSHRSSWSMEATVHFYIDSNSDIQAGVESPLTTEPSSQHCIHFPTELVYSVLDIKLEKLLFLIQWEFWWVCNPNMVRSVL